VLQLVREFILEFFTPDRNTPSTIAKRIASLNHKFGDDTMENDTLEIATPSVAYKVLNCFRGLLWEEPHVNVTKRRVYRRRVGERRGACSLPDCSGCNALFFPRGTFVEDVPFTRLVISVEKTRLDGAQEGITVLYVLWL